MVAAARRRPYHDISDLVRQGRDPAARRPLVATSGHLSPELAPLARPNLTALTEGMVNQDIGRFANPYRRPGALPFVPDAGCRPRAAAGRAMIAVGAAVVPAALAGLPLAGIHASRPAPSPDPRVAAPGCRPEGAWRTDAARVAARRAALAG